MDEVLELLGVPHEEYRGVVADHVVVAVLGIKLDGKATGVTRGVRIAPLAGYSRETNEKFGPLTFLESHSLGELGHVFSGFKKAVGAAAFGVDDTLGYAFTVESLHFLDQVVVLQKRWARAADGERVLIAGCGDAGVRGGVGAA